MKILPLYNLPDRGRQANRPTERQKEGQTDKGVFFEDFTVIQTPGSQTGSQTDRQAGRQAGRQTDRQADRQTDRQTDSFRDLVFDTTSPFPFSMQMRGWN